MIFLLRISRSTTARAQLNELQREHIRARGRESRSEADPPQDTMREEEEEGRAGQQGQAGGSGVGQAEEVEEENEEEPSAHTPTGRIEPPTRVLVLKTAVKTRWNSLFLMIER